MIRNRDLKQEIEELGHRLELIQTVLMVTNPDSALAADAYEGLRRTILQSLSATRALHAALAQIDSVASTSEDIEHVRLKVRELLQQHGVVKVTEYSLRPDAFERIGPGPSFNVVRPAYVTTKEMPPVLSGIAETLDGADSQLDGASPALPTDVETSAPDADGDGGSQYESATSEHSDEPGTDRSEVAP